MKSAQYLFQHVFRNTKLMKKSRAIMVVINAFQYSIVDYQSWQLFEVLLFISVEIYVVVAFSYPLSHSGRNFISLLVFLHMCHFCLSFSVSVQRLLNLNVDNWVLMKGVNIQLDAFTGFCNRFESVRGLLVVSRLF